MTASAVADTAPLHAMQAPGRVPGNKGIWIGITCELVGFLVLFLVYFVARAYFPESFEQGGEKLSRLAGTAITLLMLTSSFFIACSVVTMRAGCRRASIAWLLAALVMALGYPFTKNHLFRGATGALDDAIAGWRPGCPVWQWRLAGVASRDARS